MASEIDAALDAELNTNPAANVAVANAVEPTPAPVQTQQPEPVQAPTPATEAATPTPAPTPAPSQPEYRDARDYMLRALGYQAAAQYNDDPSAIQGLVQGFQTAQQQLNEARQLAQYGQLYLQEQARRVAPQPQQADPLAAYKAPEWNPNWLNSIVKDPATGQLSVAPGADPAILPKFMAYQTHRQELADKLFSDPAAFLQPLVQKMVQDQASSLVQERLGADRQEQYVNGFMRENAGWLFNRDSAGNSVINPATGKPIMSAAGQRFYSHLRDAENMGISAPEHQEQYARRMLTLDLAQPSLQRGNALAANDAAKQNVLDQMNRRPNQATPAPPIASTEQSHLSLAERMTNALKQSGFTEESMQMLTPG